MEQVLKKTKAQPYDDTADLAAARAGDKKALGRLLQSHDRFVRNVVTKRHPILREEIDDIMQDTKLRAVRGLDSFRGDSSFRSWMTTIALNCCNSFFKYEMPKRLGTTHFNEFDNNSDDDATGLKEEFIVDPSRNDPEDIVGDRELICLLEKFLESASPSTRQGFELCFDNQLNDMQYQELADAHCVPVGTVRSRMFRFRAHAASYILKATGDLTDGSESAPSGAPVLKQRRDDRWQQKPNAPHKKVPKTSPEPQ